ncbi:MAG TPA: VanZ family protein [Nitrospiraceae bacterium]|nr:VanZ family protein [Nitrospiraceae bacterium]
MARNFNNVMWRYWVPVLCYAGLIFFLSDQPHPEEYVPVFAFQGGDKLGHALEYSVLGILCYRAFRHAAGEWASRYALYLAIVASIGYGVSDEFHQYFVPLRKADGWDVLADTIGASLGAWGWCRGWRLVQLINNN